MGLKFKRILLKLSGEAFSKKDVAGIDFEMVNKIALEIAKIKKMGIEIAIVTGGGNIWRYRDNQQSKIDRTVSDSLGMMATVMNSVVLGNALSQNKIGCEIFSAINVPSLTELYLSRKAKMALKAGKIVICAGGTGNPYFTTDSAAALRALELDCEVILKATNVDYVYSDDPKKNFKAKILKQITYDDFLKNELGVMDLTAIALCREKKMPIVVFNFEKKGNLEKIIKGEKIGTRISIKG